MNWIFNTNRISYKADNQKIKKISFTQKRKFSGKIGEDIILLEYKNKNWAFTKHYEIINIEQDKINEDYNKITITLELKNIFKEDKLIEDYSYSLLRVTNFVNPEKHYNRRYNRIENVEFEAIVYDKIYINRTILGVIFNSLHRDHQKAFIQYITKNDPKLIIKKPNINEALEYLYQYLEQNVIEPINYLKEIEKLYELNFGDQELTKLEFAEDNESYVSNKIKLQLEIIRENEDFITNISNIPLDIRLNDINNDSRFINLFKNSRLPLTLN